MAEKTSLPPSFPATRRPHPRLKRALIKELDQMRTEAETGAYPWYVLKLAQSAITAIHQNNDTALAETARQIGEEAKTHRALLKPLLMIGRNLARNPAHLDTALHAATYAAQFTHLPHLALQAVTTMINIAYQPEFLHQERAGLFQKAHTLVPSHSHIKEYRQIQIITARNTARQHGTPPGNTMKFLFQMTKIELGHDHAFKHLARRADNLSWRIYTGHQAATGLPRLENW